MQHVGYAIKRTSNDELIALKRDKKLPWQVSWAGGVTSFDAVDQEAPDSANPQVVLKELWADLDVPSDQKRTGWNAPVWQNGRFEVTPILVPIPPEQIEQRERRNAFRDDPDVVASYALLTGSNPSQVDNWIDNNVTDVVSSRAVLKRLFKMLGAYL